MDGDAKKNTSGVMIKKSYIDIRKIVSPNLPLDK